MRRHPLHLHLAQFPLGPLRFTSSSASLLGASICSTLLYSPTSTRFSNIPCLALCLGVCAQLSPSLHRALQPRYYVGTASWQQQQQQNENESEIDPSDDEIRQVKEDEQEINWETVKEKPGLYVVATPIGNLEDISARALRVLRSSSLICCEDTRTTKQMLLRLGILSPSSRSHSNEKQEPNENRIRFLSYHQHSPPSRLATIIDFLKQGRHIVSIVSDAGTPLISDPGAPLVAEAHKHHLPVFCIPGPSGSFSGGICAFSFWVRF